MYMLTVVVDRPSFRFVDDVMITHNEANRPESKITLCFVQFARWLHRGEVAVYDCGLIKYATKFLQNARHTCD